MSEYHKKKNKNSLFKRIYQAISSPIAFLASIITIVMVIADSIPIIRYIILAVIIVYLFLLVFYIVKSIFKTSYAKSELEKDHYLRNINLAKEIHKYFHNLRNYIESINVEKIISYSDVEEQGKTICNFVEKFYNTLFSGFLDKHNICVCIKLVKTNTLFNEDYNSWSMETLARSTSTPQDRFNIDKKLVKIEENSDFQIILSEKYPDDLFSFSDMSNIREDFLKIYETPYKNSRGENFLDYYRSTIVVPIKIDGKFAPNIINKYENIDNKDLILGFLCIDSMKEFKTSAEKNIFSVGVEYGKSFADSLYILFGKILQSCLKNAKITEN